ncbi:hypothetical protein HG263_02745 [Pseudoalteromonas sp. JBTF-M23]|uniref:Uncharacterized protein n=1 Tax=Pseudoalteromonas caenipelagi TaxID=2726988 RepID=A0A849V986_9GAMM|nr:hypothetical protein [Pseudoalteromonas caenipelagi]NOU49465.1 hypothetical protein [Pseudoalteromonas caenipelagi]
MKTQSQKQLHLLPRKQRGLKSINNTCSIALITLVASFSQLASASTYPMTTQANDDGQGNMVFLDRHHLNCGSDALNSMHLYRPTPTQIAYEYGCTNMANSSSNTMYTQANDDGGGNVVFLDRHTVNCEGKGIQYLHLERPTSNTIRYHYTCGNKVLFDVKDYFTNADEDGGGNAVYLDRQNVSCPNESVLSYLRLERPTSNTIRYHYKCGSYYENAIYGFVNSFDPANWNISGVAASTMTSSALSAHVTNGGGGVTAAISVPADGTISFNWNIQIYSSGQYGDYIQYVLNGVVHSLSTSGSASGLAQGIKVKAGDVFELVTWGTTQSSSYNATFDNFIFIPDTLGFTGDFSPNKWTVSGVAASNMSASALTANVVSGGGGVTASTTLVKSGVISFNWNIAVNSAGQYGDYIRYVINGVSYPLSTAGSASGVAENIQVNAGDVFELQTWGTTQSSSYNAVFDNFTFSPSSNLIQP